MSTLDLDEAYRLYTGGMSFSQVAAVLGCTKSYVARRFRAAGLPARSSGRPLTTPPPVVDPTDIVRLRDAGYSFPRIAAELGLSADSARDRYLNATGRPRRATAGQPPEPKRRTGRRRPDATPGDAADAAPSADTPAAAQRRVRGAAHSPDGGPAGPGVLR